MEHVKFRWIDGERQIVNVHSCFSLARILKIDKTTAGFPFKLDYGQVNKLHLNDDWVSNGRNVALQKNNKKLIENKHFANYFPQIYSYISMFIISPSSKNLWFNTFTKFEWMTLYFTRLIPATRLLMCRKTDRRSDRRSRSPTEPLDRDKNNRF